MEKNLSYYLDCFSRLNRAVIRGYKAPHKPILLLSVIELIVRDGIQTNCIYLDDNLIYEFKRQWQNVVEGSNEYCKQMVCEALDIQATKYPFSCDISKPFFHMQHEPFWNLIKKDCWEKKQEYSLNALKDNYEFALMDKDLYELIKEEQYRAIICDALINSI